MPRKARELTALEVGRIQKPWKAVGGVPGLGLQVRGAGRSWVLRFSTGAGRREMGLGSYPEVGLADARLNARRAREQVRDGVDPIAERKAAKSKLAALAAKVVTFKQAAAAFVAANAAAWKNPKHVLQWASTLETYVHPVIGDISVTDVETAHIISILTPIWTTKTETASRVRGRIESVLDWARASGYRSGENPARWKGHLNQILPRPSRVVKPEHHAALPFQEMGAFMARLRAQNGGGARALEFAILTAARSGEVRGATWGEVDLNSKVWVIPGSRMKAGRDHRVPLSDASVDLLNNLPRIAGTEFIFPAARGGQLSDMTLSAVCRRMGEPVVPHGFRSSFRDWAAERTNYPSEMAEMALAHTVTDKVEAAYRRGDMFDRRRAMMTAWASFCAQPLHIERGEVIAMRRQA